MNKRNTLEHWTILIHVSSLQLLYLNNIVIYRDIF